MESAGEPIYTPRGSRRGPDLETELQETVANLDLEDYENKPVPR